MRGSHRGWRSSRRSPADPGASRRLRPDVHQRLVFYKRFSGAGSAEISDLRAGIVDRFGELPERWMLSR